METYPLHEAKYSWIYQVKVVQVKVVFHKFTWSIREYFVPHNVSPLRSLVMITENENENANLCCNVNRQSIQYDFHTTGTPTRYYLNMI